MRRKPVILCVHPQLANMQPILARLYEVGCDVLAADDQLSAIRILQSEAVDVLLLHRTFSASIDAVFLTAEVRKISPQMPILLIAPEEDSLAERFVNPEIMVHVTSSTHPNVVLEIIKKLTAKKPPKAS